MWDCYLRDTSFLSSDLLTGKSLPVLVAISTLPLDPNLLGTMVLLGATMGALVNLRYAWSVITVHTVNWVAYFLHNLFSAFLSCSFLLHLAGRVRNGGAGISILPLYVVLVQGVSESIDTCYVSLMLSMTLGWLNLVYEPPSHSDRYELASAVVALPGTFSLQEYHDPAAAQRTLLAMDKQYWYKTHHREAHLPHPSQQPHYVSTSVQDNLLHSVIILMLTFYASLQHTPVALYVPTAVDPSQSKDRLRMYVSVNLLVNRLYSIWVAMTAALIRSFVLLTVGLIQRNSLHVIYDPSHDYHGTVPLVCYWVYLVALTHSGTWAMTQFTLAWACMNLGPQQASNILSQERTKQLKDYCTDMRLRWAVVLLALSSLYKWEDPVIAMSLVLPMLGTSIVGIIVDSEP
jgi:hypothetical protein